LAGETTTGASSTLKQTKNKQQLEIKTTKNNRKRREINNRLKKKGTLVADFLLNLAIRKGREGRNWGSYSKPCG
jgi:hypothetical protein